MTNIGPGAKPYFDHDDERSDCLVATKQSKKMFVGLTKEKNGDYRFSETKKESSSIEAALVLDRGHGDHDPSPGKHHKRDPHSRANRLELLFVI